MRKIVGFLIVTFLMLALLCVVASAETTVDLLAGQDILAGTVTVSYDGVELCVTYETIDGWELVETHWAIATSSGDIPQTKKGNPKVGHFPYGDDELGEYDAEDNLIGGDDSYEECIEIELEAGIYIIAAHASLLNLDNIVGYVPETDPAVPIYQEETGWGEGNEFADDRNWAMYFTFEVVVAP
ncbi:MAG: hypothetical protein WBF68_05350 [Atribacterota bacterium]